MEDSVKDRLTFRQEAMDAGNRMGLAVEFRVDGRLRRLAVAAPVAKFDRAVAERALTEKARACGWNG